MHLQTLPLSQLRASPRNVRRTGGQHVDDLAASIASHGLLQNLIVSPAADGTTFDVIAGARRLLALNALADKGQLPAEIANAGVPCQVLDMQTTDGEVSLAENVIRAPMHPADQFEAFARLVDAGLSVGDVAARFGIKPVFVEQRLRLSRVAPELVKTYREGGLTLEQLEAFAISDEHKLQLGYWRGNLDTAWKLRPEEIRRGLAKGEIELARDPRGLLVGPDALVAAGGQVRRDLFEPAGGFTRDAKLLDKLAMAKLETAAEPVRAEGWSYVEVLPHWEDRHERATIDGRTRKPSAEEVIERAQLVTRYDALAGLDDMTPAQQTELDAVSDQLESFDQRLTVWTDDQRAKAGAVITLSRSGYIEIHRGVLRAGQRASTAPSKGASSGKDSKGSKATPNTVDLTAALSMRLAAQRTMALRAEVAARADIALIAVVHNLAGRVFYKGCASDLQISISTDEIARADPKIDKSTAAVELKRVHTAWRARLPQNPSELWKWLGDQGQDTLLNLLAYCAATTIMATDFASDPKRYAQTAADLAAAVDLDMAKWWKPTVEHFLGSVPKSVILAALREASAQPIIDAEKLDSAKADALAARAEPILCNPAAVWLPPLLRGPKWRQGAVKAEAKPVAAPKAAATPPKAAKPAAKPKAKAKAKPAAKGKPAKSAKKAK